MSSARKYDHLFKIVIAGDQGVGKSNLLLRYTRDTFQQDSKPTVGVEFAIKCVEIEGKRIESQIWDTAGQERYRAIASLYYRQAVGALLVYDITNFESFENLPLWLTEIRTHGKDDIVVGLLGNKLDLRHIRAVTTAEGQQFASENNLLFLETSSLDAHNVELAFEDMIYQVYKVHGRDEPEQTIPMKSEPASGSKCCNI